MKLYLIGAAALVSAGPALAQSMPLPQLLDRAAKLEKKGPLALLSRGEIKALTGEVQASALALRQERLAALKAGRKPAYCPPDGSKQNTMGSTELLKALRAIPAAERARMTTKDGMRTVLARKYPCAA